MMCYDNKNMYNERMIFMKKKFAVLIASLAVALLPVIAVNATLHFAEGADMYIEDKNDIHIFMNNRLIKYDQPPVLVNNRTLVPMRAIFEALGAKVEWIEETQTAAASKEDKTINITVNTANMTVNGEVKELDVPAQIIGDRTMVPLRAVSEALDCKVVWTGSLNTVNIIPKQRQAYSVSVTNEDGVNIGTVYYNDENLIYEIIIDDTGAFMPFFANINGNTFFEFCKKGTTRFTYNEGAVERITHEDENGLMTYEIKQNSDGGVCDYGVNTLYGDDFEYVRNESTGETSTSGRSPNYPDFKFITQYTFNNLGLISEVHGDDAVYFTYNTDGQLTGYKSSRYFYNYKYSYDASGDISSCGNKSTNGGREWPEKKYTYKISSH